MSTDATTPGAVPLDEAVRPGASAPRPRAWALPISPLFGGGDYLRSAPSLVNDGSPFKWEPLYDQATLDAAVAAVREDYDTLFREYHHACAEASNLKRLLEELRDCGAVDNWLRVGDDLKARIEALLKA
jgi:hypothetical protein